MEVDGPTIVRKENTIEQGPIATVLNSPFQDAITALAQLQTDLGASIAVINGANLGPYNLGGSCDYDCILGVCWKTYHWNWPLDFQYLRQPLQGAVQQVGQAAGQFDSAFQPARNWLKVTLPQFSADFTAQANTILATNAAIQASGGTATADQIATLQAAFADIIAGIGNGQQQMQTAIQAMADFNQELGGCEEELGQVTSQQQSAIDNWINTTWNNFVGGMDCGQSDADNQVNGAIATFNGAIAAIQTSFNTLAADGSAVSNATAELVGVFANINDQYGLVAGQISESQAYPAGPLADLHLDIAESEWTQLAQYAQQNIQ
jgi:hypothetical protein